MRQSLVIAMRISRSTKRVMTNDDGLIPMINIVFLLLVFFMVAGTIKPGEPLDIQPPESAQTGNQSASHVVHVAVDGTLALDGRVLSEADLGLAVSNMMRANESSEPDKRQPDNASDDLASSTSGGTVGSTVTRDVLVDVSPLTETELSTGTALAIRADGRITFERLREVINLLGNAGVSDVELLTALIPSVAD